MDRIHCIPENKEDRTAILEKVRQYVAAQALFPPLSLEELEEHSDIVLSEARYPASYKNWAMVLLNNELWKNTVASIPYSRRIFFLPQCMKAKECKGEMDEMGLLCAQCGSCDMGEIQAQAEELGYAVLIAEGTTFVTSLLAQGKCDAVIGVSCLETLERAFPHMVSHATPGIAIPLYKGGCKDTKADRDWIQESLLLKSSEKKEPVRLNRIQNEVNSWFSMENLTIFLGKPESDVARIALGWLSKSGKRWRPLLTVATYQALAAREYPLFLKKIAIAVECFHKASLIHDDIEDQEANRYEEATLHQEYGIPVALNVGDYMIGLGYELLSSCGISAEKIGKMIRTAAQSHLALCAGQGEELAWRRSLSALSLQKAISIFQEKTAPAFSVALVLGALAADAPEAICQMLQKYSEFLGIAYQIQDDIKDLEQECSSLSFSSPSLFLAIACEEENQEQKVFLESFFSQQSWKKEEEEKLREILKSPKIQEKATRLKKEYISKAYKSLCLLQNTDFKQLLYRILGKIIQD